jgi:hypothetical protein
MMSNGKKRNAEDSDHSSKRARDQVESEIDEVNPCGHDSPPVAVGEQTAEVEADSKVAPGFKTGPWVYDEDERLIQAVGMLQTPSGDINWHRVGLFLGNRSEDQCAVRWTTLLQYRGVGSNQDTWSPEEDCRLVEAVAHHERKGGGVYWAKVSEEMGNGRTYEQCLKRWKQVQQGGPVQISAWTDEEDARLCEALALYDEQGNASGIDWDQVSEYLGGMRSGSQCSDRWQVSLKQKRKGSFRDEWTPEEDGLLVQGVSLYAGDGVGGGVDWDAVSSHLGGAKSGKQCNRRWNRVLKTDTTLEGLIRTDLWDAEEERLLFAGIDACLSHFYQHSATTVANSEGGFLVTSQQALPCAAAEDDKPQMKLSGSQEDPQRSQQEAVQVGEAREAGNQEEYDLYCQALNTLVMEVDPSTIDWVRISNDYLESRRTPKQCERRFESYQRQVLHLSTSHETFEDGGVEQLAEGDGPRRSTSRHRRRASKTEPWSAAEDERLTEAVALYQGKGRGGATDWGRVCEYVGGDRTYDQCRIRWNGGFKVPRGFGTTGRLGLWNAAEVSSVDSSSSSLFDLRQDEKLIEGVGIYDGQGKGGGVDWAKVSEYMHGDRTANQCHTRWNSILKHRSSERKTTPWTVLEDVKLTEAVATYCGQGRGGTVDWSKVRSHLGPDRSCYQHRLRWYGMLKPRVTGHRDSSPPEPWPEEEIQIIIQAVETCGSSLALKLEDDPCQYHAHQDPTPALSDLNPLASLAMTGALFAHLIDWDAVSAHVTRELGPSRAVRHSAFQCLYAWRQAMDSLGRDRVNPDDPNPTHANSPWTSLEVSAPPPPVVADDHCRMRGSPKRLACTVDRVAGGESTGRRYRAAPQLSPLLPHATVLPLPLLGLRVHGPPSELQPVPSSLAQCYQAADWGRDRRRKMIDALVVR